MGVQGRRRLIGVLAIGALLCAASQAAASPRWGHPLRVSGKQGERFQITSTSVAKGGLAAVSWISADRDHFGRYDEVVAIRPSGQRAFSKRLRIRASSNGRERFITAAADDRGEVMIAWKDQHGDLRSGVYRPGKGVSKTRKLGSALFGPQLASRPNGKAILFWQVGPSDYSFSRRRAGQGFSKPVLMPGYQADFECDDVSINDHGDAMFLGGPGWGPVTGPETCYFGKLKRGSNTVSTPVKLPGSAYVTNDIVTALTNRGEVPTLMNGSGNYEISVNATTYRPGRGFTHPRELARDEFLPSLTVDGKGNALAIWDGEVSRKGIKTTEMRRRAGGDWKHKTTIVNRTYSLDDRPVLSAPGGRALVVMEHKGRFVAVTGTVRNGLRHQETILGKSRNASQIRAELANGGVGIAAFKRARGVCVTSRHP